MATKNETQLRLMIYGTIFVVLVVCAVVFYQFLNAAENSAKSLVSTTNTESQVDYNELDLAVLESKKFKDLKAVVVPVSEKPEEKPIDDNVDLESLRKKGNPFEPSF